MNEKRINTAIQEQAEKFRSDLLGYLNSQEVLSPGQVFKVDVNVQIAIITLSSEVMVTTNTLALTAGMEKAPEITGDDWQKIFQCFENRTRWKKELVHAFFVNGNRLSTLGFTKYCEEKKIPFPWPGRYGRNEFSNTDFVSLNQVLKEKGFKVGRFGTPGDNKEGERPYSIFKIKKE